MPALRVACLPAGRVAGILRRLWIPAYAGMTAEVTEKCFLQSTINPAAIPCSARSELYAG